MGLFEPRNHEQTAAELWRLFGSDDRMTGMISDPIEEGFGTPSFERYNIRMPRTRELVKPVREFADIAGKMRRENFWRGIQLAEDAESFIDRQAYLDDGAVGSEERARGYKGEGTRELMRGIGYGAANVPDALLGLAVDEDNILRMPTQAAKSALAHKPMGDEEIDSALSAMHSLGEGVGEMAMTGAGAGLMNRGVRMGAQYVPHQMMFRAPEAMKDMLPYSWQNRAHQMPHISEAVKSPLGESLLDTANEAAIELALVNQLAQEENGGTDDLATLGALAVGTNLLGNYVVTKPKREWKPVDSKRAPYEAAIMRREAKRKKDMDAYAKEYGKPFKTINQGGKDVRVEYDWPHPAVNMRVPQMMTYNGDVIHDKRYNHPLYHLPEQYKDQAGRPLARSPRPYQIMYETYKNGNPKFVKAENTVGSRDALRDGTVIDNEEIMVYTDGMKMNEQPSVNAPLVPSDGLIFKNELKRVFGKRAQIDKTDDNTFHITLPNGVELNAQTGADIRAGGSRGRAVRRRYNLPEKTQFQLKGSLDHVDGFDLIRLGNLADADTLQHEAVHFAMNTVTTPKEKRMLRETFGDSEEAQVEGIMNAIRTERSTRKQSEGSFMNGLLRKIERFGGYIGSFVENVPTAIAKRDLSYLEGRSSKEMLRDYAESFVDGSVWGREIAPVMKEFVQKHHDELAETIEKQHSMNYLKQPRITLAQRSPNIFSLLPYHNYPLEIDRSIISKVLKEKHGDSITPEHIAQLPQALEQPVLIIKGDWEIYGKTNEKRKAMQQKREDTYNFLLDVFDKNNANIYVPIGFKADSYRGQKGIDDESKKEFVNRVKSIYGLTPNNKMQKRPDIKKIMQMVKHNDLVYVDKDKLLSLVKDYAPQKYDEMRDYLDHNLPEHVYTPESYRAFRNRRGMKPELDLPENYFDPVDR